MEITPSTVPGTGTVYQIRTRGGGQLAVIDYRDGRRGLTVYDVGDPDDPAHLIELESDEADRIAELLHSPSLDARLAAIERRLDELAARP